MKINLNVIPVSPYTTETQLVHPNVCILMLTFLRNFAAAWLHKSEWDFCICQRSPSSMTTRENKSEQLLRSHPRENQSGDSFHAHL